MKDTTIRGYRVGTEAPKPSRELKMDYLHPTKEAASLGRRLTLEVLKTNTPCTGREEEFSGDNLLSERDAALACSPCPLFDLCEQYRQAERPAHGIYAGKVKNMIIPEED